MTEDFMVVIPARGGSKRVPGKNIRPLGGKPLLAYSIAAAVEAGIGGSTVVSTEDDNVAAIARQLGARTIRRPVSLATDTASTEGVLIHALDDAAKEGWRPRWIVTMPPTSPFRSAATIRAFLAQARDGAPDCIFSLTETRADLWRQDTGGSLVRLFPDAPRRQQDRAPLYEENSALYVTAASALRRTGSILGTTRRGIVIDPLEAFDINTELDFSIAAALIAGGEVPRTPPRPL